MVEVSAQKEGGRSELDVGRLSAAQDSVDRCDRFWVGCQQVGKENRWIQALVYNILGR